MGWIWWFGKTLYSGSGETIWSRGWKRQGVSAGGSAGLFVSNVVIEKKERGRQKTSLTDKAGGRRGLFNAGTAAGR